MAAQEQSAENLVQVFPSRRKENKVSKVFVPKDTLDQPCDVVLMVKGGKQFKAHRRVLSESSPFFAKLFNSDMKETREGVVRLEIFTESVMATALKFIYTGDVQILDEDNARDLIAVADYLFLDKLKPLAGGVLVQTLNISNSISTYYFAERYQCEDLLSNIRKFILANFTSIYAANRENVLNMSSNKVEMWISSDEIDVNAEEDVFKIILAWIDHDRSRRRRFFVELFRHVRLVYVSRDFLLHDIVTNELVQDNSSCLTLVRDAINLLDSENFEILSVPPRRTLEISTIVVNAGENVLCYFPRDNIWCKLGEIPTSFLKSGNFVSYERQLYRTEQEVSNDRLQYSKQLKQITFNPYSNSFTQLPDLKEERYLRRTFARNGDEMYALMSEPCLNHCVLVNPGIGADHTCSSRKHTSFLTKYKPESKSWEDVTSFNHLDLRDNFCIVANDNFIYFIGGREWRGNKRTILTDVDRFDLNRKQWDKAADTQMANCMAKGTAVKEKIYITFRHNPEGTYFVFCEGEVYDETTNEWQIITGIRDGLGFNDHLLAVDGELYILHMKSLSCLNFSTSGFPKRIRIERYCPEGNKWETKTEVTARRTRGSIYECTIVCSMRIFKGLFNMQHVEAFPADDSLPLACTTQPSLRSKKRERKCLIM